MATKYAVIGILGTATAALAIRSICRQWTNMQKIARLTNGSPFVHYYKGGFEPKMTKREASLVLNVSQTSTKETIRDAHKRVMLLNHPDRNGSPYIAAKINEAKSILESNQ